MKKSESNLRRSESTFPQFVNDDNRHHRRSENYFHEPRVNRIKTLQDNLQDIKNCVPQHIKDVDELSQRTKEILLKNASSKLNVNSKEFIFKDLPTLESTQRKVPEKSDKASATSSSHEEKKKFKEMQMEYYNRLSREMEKPTIRELEVTPLPGENDFLAITKYSHQHLLTSTKREEIRRFLDSCTKDARRSHRFEEDARDAVDLDALTRLVVQKRTQDEIN